MDIKTLESRIAKKETEIAKITKRKNKHYDACIKNGLTDEEIQNMESLPYKEFKNYFNKISYDAYYACSDYRSAVSDLESAMNTLNKYKNNLALEMSKSQATKIQVIVDFLDGWKKNVTEFVLEDVKTYLEYLQLDNKSCEIYNHRGAYQREYGDDWRSVFDSEYKKLRELAKKVYSSVNPITREVYSSREENHVDMKRLDEILEKEKEAKYWSLVDRVTEITGEITDASLLHIGLDGNLNGFIKGENGTAKVETVAAGGYNEGTIVNVRHGQCLHFRVLVHKVA